MASTGKEKKSYHKVATGLALETAKAHSAPHELQLYGGCFCPFVQRVWISLEMKKLEYQVRHVEQTNCIKPWIEVRVDSISRSTRMPSPKS